MFFIAKIKYEKQKYGNNDFQTFEEIRIVIADNENIAYDKVVKYFNDKTEEYCVYYTVKKVEILETIE